MSTFIIKKIKKVGLLREIISGMRFADKRLQQANE
jgi:hypothetical protein